MPKSPSAKSSAPTATTSAPGNGNSPHSPHQHPPLLWVDASLAGEVFWQWLRTYGWEAFQEHARENGWRASDYLELPHQAVAGFNLTYSSLGWPAFGDVAAVTPFGPPLQ